MNEEKSKEMKVSKGCIDNMIGKQVYNDFVYVNPRPFSFGELQLEIKKRGGLQLFDIGYTIGRKVRDADEEGEIIFNAKENKYYPKSLENSIK